MATKKTASARRVCVRTAKKVSTPVRRSKTPRTPAKTRKTAKPKKTVPIEDVECVNFVDWLNKYAPEIEYAHIANESRSSKKDAAIRGRKLHRMGQRRGVWDYELFVPIYDVDGEIGTYQELRIEMKRQRGGGSTVSPEQKKWGKLYELAGIPCRICYGANEAVKFVREYYKKENEIEF